MLQRNDHRWLRLGCCGAAVLLISSVCLNGPVSGAAAGSWERVPVVKWDPEKIAATTGGQRLLDAELRRQGESVRRWKAVHELVGKRHVSAKAHRQLAARGLGPARLSGQAGGFDKGFEGIDTLRVLLVRIGFDGNRDPQLTTVPAGGGFMLEPLAAPGLLEVDPPPHDKAYFDAHLQGLSEYYRFMSGRRLHIEGRVLPEAGQGAYVVKDVADYGPGAGGFWSIDGLEALVRDMITATDAGTQADGSVSLADYDDDDPFTYVIFVHAGSDWQSDVNGDSPNDVPTFFVNLGEPQALTSVDMDGGTGALSECSVIPETTNQDGFTGSIAAAFYHEFGHALGLVDVYDTSRGLPSVGIWDLMDSGTNLAATLGAITEEGDTLIVAATGVLPPSLSAWGKWFLGWIETDEIGGDNGEYRLPAVGVPREDYARWVAAGAGAFNLSDPQALRGGLSPREWFLIENRWVPWPTEPLIYDQLSFERDEATGVILYLAGRLPDGEWENSGLYDYFLPAGGVLVWHVNDDRIAEGLADNTVNSYGDGLKLVEADGIQDIGVLDAYVQGWYGSWRDPFGGRDSRGNFTGFNRLPIEGFPNSRMFDRSWSHLSLSDIAPRVVRTSSIMKFSASLGNVPRGLPWEIAAVSAADAARFGGAPGPRAIAPGSLTPVVVGGTQLLVFADAPGDKHGESTFDAALYAVTADGRRYWAQVPDRAAGAFLGLGDETSGPPVAVDAGSGATDLFVALRGGQVWSVRLGAAGVGSNWQVDVGDSLVGGVIPLRASDAVQRLAVLSLPDRIHLLDATGTPVGEPLQLTLPAGGAPRLTGALPLRAVTSGDGDALCAVSRNGWHLVAPDASGLSPTPQFLAFPRLAGGPVRIGVVSIATGTVVHAFDDVGFLGSWRVSAGVATAVDQGPKLTEGPVCDPAVADLNGDGRDDLVVATSSRVFAFEADGVPLRGWPRRLSDMFPLADTVRVAGPLIVADGTGDGQNEVFFNTDMGHLIALGPDGRLLERFPIRWGDHRTPAMAIGDAPPVDGSAERLLWLVSEGGYTGAPFDRTLVNGRIGGWQLEKRNVGGSSVATSEWLGTGGGVARNGPSGVARDLGPGSLAAADRLDVSLFPNPLAGTALNVRFFSDGEGEARLAVYNLQGEKVRERSFGVSMGQMNQVQIELPELASGLYVTVLEYDGSGGRQVRTMTLAVER